MFGRKKPDPYQNGNDSRLLIASDRVADKDVNLRIIGSLIKYLVDHWGVAKTSEIAAKAKIPVEDMTRCAGWVSLDQVETILAEVFSLLGDDEGRFREACGYKLAEGYGPARYLLWATSPTSLYRMATRTMHLVSNISRWEIVDQGRNWMNARYVTRKKESRLLCLSRQANIISLPTMWGLPPAEFTETSCVSRGDPYCEYHGWWREKVRYLWTVGGLLAGGVSAYAAARLGFASPLLALLPITGAALGQTIELWRVSRAGTGYANEFQKAFARFTNEEAATRQEIMDLHRRQAEWVNVLERQVSERTAELVGIFEQFRKSNEERAKTIRGLAHDINNKLGALVTGAPLLEESVADLNPDLKSMVAEQVASTSQLHQLFNNLLAATIAQGRLLKHNPQPLPVAPLADKLRKRLAALVYGKPISVTVFCTREAPEQINVDQLIFDRLIDNLFTNAAKYTERGSIMVEVTGEPGMLVLKVSDTGRGIEHDLVERVFLAEGSEPAERAASSHGLGLSIVVKLLDEIGGRLEVMSKVGTGTTFWLKLLVDSAPVATAPEKAAVFDELEMVGKVVTIRRAG